MQSSQNLRESNGNGSDIVKAEMGNNATAAKAPGPVPTTLPEDEPPSVDDDETSSSGSSDLTDDEDTHKNSKQALSTKGKGITHSNTVKDAGDPDIHNRLASFFSRLAEQRSRPDTADEVIEKGSDSDSGFEDEDENEGRQYIELDLAMGVLSEEADGKRFDDVELPVETHSEPSESDDEPLQKLTTIAKANSGTHESKSNKAKKRTIEELG